MAGTPGGEAVLSGNRILFVAAAVLGTLPILVGAGSHRVPVMDMIGLADAMANGSDLVLLDARAGSADSLERIPSGVPPSDSVVRSLAEGGSHPMVVVYGNTAAEVAEVIDQLSESGVESLYRLDGALEEWYREVVYPVLPAGAGPSEEARFERVAELSRYFGGIPRRETGGGTARDSDRPRQTCGF